jgi:hypothetical protein
VVGGDAVEKKSLHYSKIQGSSSAVVAGIWIEKMAKNPTKPNLNQPYPNLT